MATGQHEDIAHELMEDFFQDFTEAHQQCEHTLIALEQSPDDTELLNALFRNIHTVKGNLVYVGLKDITPILQSVEDILDAIRKGTLNYDTSLSDIILLTLDKSHAMVEARVNHQAPPMPESSFDELCQWISRVAEVGESARAAAIRQALTLLDPDLALYPREISAENAPPPYPVIPVDSDINTVLNFFGIDIDEDMRFFVGLNEPFEARSRFWEGRTRRLLRLALAMNKHANSPVDPAQLAAAVILHDMGMSFMPVDVLHAKSMLSKADQHLLQSHPQHGHALLLPMQRWATAALAILQHHERVDGYGYPNKIEGSAISDAAKIVSIVDTFEARTHERAHTHLTKRPFIRAVLEINSCAGSQFDPAWVDIFNQVARALKSQNGR